MARRCQTAARMVVVVVCVVAVAAAMTAGPVAARLPPAPAGAAASDEASGSLNLKRSGSSSVAGSGGCPGCSRDRLSHQLGEAVATEHLKRARIENFAQQLLKGLGLKEPPHVPPALVSSLRSKLRLPGDLLGDEAKQEHRVRDGTPGPNGHLFIFATDAASHECSKPAQHEQRLCLEFNMSNDQVLKVIGSARLKLYAFERASSGGGGGRAALPHVELAGLEGDDTGAVVSVTVTSAPASGEGRWLSFELSPTATRTAQSNGRLTLELVCRRGSHDDDACGAVVLPSSDGVQKPFILVSESDGPAKKVRRDSDRFLLCSERDPRGSHGRRSCCLEKLHLNFHKDLNFTFIWHPTEVDINFCRGTCDVKGVRYQHAYTHTYLLQMMGAGREQGEVLAPCCAPIELNSLTVIYVLPGGIFKDGTLPNMSVGGCGCF